MLDVLLQVLQIGLLGFFLSLILASAVHKLKEPARFRQAFVAYELLPHSWALPAAKVVPFIELGVTAVAIIAFTLVTPFITSVVIFSLFATYAAFLAHAALTNKKLEDCGCSLNSPVAEVEPARLLVRNLMLMALVAVFYFSFHSYSDSMAVWAMGIIFSLLIFITYNSIDGVMENHALLKNLRVRHD
jgi:uncharacterized membrane protein YhaH (DUF805 family)|tara:strand:- start:2102 stop:2665 length:564 start_codon:yes stop_codon:yes gene_type:complete